MGIVAFEDSAVTFFGEPLATWTRPRDRKTEKPLFVLEASMIVDGSGSSVAPPIAKPTPAPGPTPAAATNTSQATAVAPNPSAGPAAKPDGIDLTNVPQLLPTPPLPLDGNTATTARTGQRPDRERIP